MLKIKYNDWVKLTTEEQTDILCDTLAKGGAYTFKHRSWPFNSNKYDVYLFDFAKEDKWYKKY